MGFNTKQGAEGVGLGSRGGGQHRELRTQDAEGAGQVLETVAGGEMGDVLRSVANAMADDGTIDAREAGLIIRAVDDCMAKLAALRATAMQIRGKA